MEISDIRIRKILREGRLRAVISLTIDGALAVHDIKVVQGDGRLFVAMPSRRDDMGTYRDIIHPINPETRNLFEEKILKMYEEYVSSDGANLSAETRDFDVHTGISEPSLDYVPFPERPYATSA